MSCHLCPKETSFWMWGDALELNDNIQFSYTIVYIFICIYIHRCSYRIILVFSDVLTTSLGISRLISGTDDNQLPLKVMRVPIARLSVDLALTRWLRCQKHIKKINFWNRYLYKSKNTSFSSPILGNTFLWIRLKECCLNIKKKPHELETSKKKSDSTVSTPSSSFLVVGLERYFQVLKRTALRTRCSFGEAAKVRRRVGWIHLSWSFWKLGVYVIPLLNRYLGWSINLRWCWVCVLSHSAIQVGRNVEKGHLLHVVRRLEASGKCRFHKFFFSPFLGSVKKLYLQTFRSPGYVLHHITNICQKRIPDHMLGWNRILTHPFQFFLGADAWVFGCEVFWVSLGREGECRVVRSWMPVSLHSTGAISYRFLGFISPDRCPCPDTYNGLCNMYT